MSTHYETLGIVGDASAKQIGAFRTRVSISNRHSCRTGLPCVLIKEETRGHDLLSLLLW